MGKLLGLPMGVTSCACTARILSGGQQMATEQLTAAGANYYMDVGLNTDRILRLFRHQRLTTIKPCARFISVRPLRNYLRWALTRGIFARDPNGQLTRGSAWGDVRSFCESDEQLRPDRSHARDAWFCHGGAAMTSEVSRRVRCTWAVGREAIRA